MFYRAYEARLGLANGLIGRAYIVLFRNTSLGPLGRAEELMRRAFPNVDLVVVSGFDPLFPHDFAILTGIANLPSIENGYCP